MASYTKLRDGTWGIRGPLPAPATGQVVSVQTKAGAVKSETVGRVLWTGTDYQGQPAYLATIGARPSRGTAKARSGYGCDCEDCHGRCPNCRCDALCVCRGGNIYGC